MRTRIDPVAVANNSDPEPWLTPRFSNAGCFATEAKSSTPSADALTATVEVLSTMANALQTDEKVYIVGYADGELAATTFSGRIGVGVGALTDPSLTRGQRAALLTGAMVHEVGHINNLRLWVDEVGAAFGIPEGASGAGIPGWQPTDRQAMALRVLNIASDIHDEEAQRQRYVGYADTLDVLIWYAAGGHAMTDGSQPITGPKLDGGFDQRFNEALGAARFPWVRDWTQTTEATEWLTWWDQWAEDSAQANSASTMTDIVSRGVDKIMGDADPVTPKGDEQGDEPGEEPGEDSTTCGPNGPSGGKPEPKGDGGHPPKADGDDTDDTEGDDDGDGDGDGKGDPKDGPKGNDGKGKGGETTDPVDPPTEEDDDSTERKPGRGPGGTTKLTDPSDLKLPECPVDALHRAGQDGVADLRVATTLRGRRSGVKSKEYSVTQGGVTVIHKVVDETNGAAK